MEMTLKEWLPLIAVTGPILAALITLAATRYFRERKRLLFVAVRTEDLTVPLRRARESISFKIDDQEVLELNRALVYVRNRGNVAIEAPEFRVRIRGARQLRLFDIRSTDQQLKSSVKATWVDNLNDAVLSVSLPFLNRKDSFSVAIFFDGVTVDCDIMFRMAGVDHIVRKNATITAFGPEAVDALLSAYENIPLFGRIFRGFSRLPLFSRVRSRSASLRRLSVEDDDER